MRVSMRPGRQIGHTSVPPPHPGTLISMHVHGTANQQTQRVLRFSLVATLAYVVVTFIAGVEAHSLALISEAGHNVSDSLALALSFVAVYFQSRPATEKKLLDTSGPAFWPRFSTR